jgi:hypothetical protein
LPAVAQQAAGQTPAGQQAGTVKSQVSEPPATPPASGFTLPIAPPSKPEPVAAKPETIVATVETAKPGIPQAVPTPASTPQVSGLLPAVAQQTAGQTPGSQQGTTVQSVTMSGKAIDYIENLHVAGVRASATDSKVLMNDRVYRLGDMVERELHLRLVGITSGSLTFENEAGARYTRNL